MELLQVLCKFSMSSSLFAGSHLNSKSLGIYGSRAGRHARHVPLII